MRNTKTCPYLSGNLILTSIKDKVTVGRLVTYDPNIDDFIEFKAIAVCDAEDEYNENIGENIVKLKIAKQYYSYKKQYAAHVKNELLSILKDADNEYEFCNRKLENITSSLEKYGLSFYK